MTRNSLCPVRDRRERVVPVAGDAVKGVVGTRGRGARGRGTGSALSVAVAISQPLLLRLLIFAQERGLFPGADVWGRDKGC